jgi:short-subunit dehydrogenase
MKSLQNQWTLVTEASSGIGKACAELFAKNKSHLIIRPLS